MPDELRPRATRLSPGGAGALAVWRLEGDVGLALTTRAGRARAWPAHDEVVVAHVVGGGEVLDEAVVIGLADGAREVCLHGGAGVEARWCAALASAGVDVDVRAARAPDGLRAAVATASSRAGVLRALVDRLDGTPRDDAPTRADVARALARATFAERLVAPPRVRLVGPPNAGKSTLFNALLGRHRALVSPVEGTTRDAVAAPWVLRGVSVVLEDTAGVDGGASGRRAPGLLEVAVTSGDVVDPGSGLAVRTHADLRRGRPSPVRTWDVSGTTGEGLEALRAAMAEALEIPASVEDDVWTPILAEDRARLAAWWRPSGG